TPPCATSMQPWSPNTYRPRPRRNAPRSPPGRSPRPLRRGDASAQASGMVACVPGEPSSHGPVRASGQRLKGEIMGLAGRILISLALISLAPAALAATITGNVQGPDGKPFMGAFVVAENTQNRMTVSVLSNAQGRYHIGNLPAATYTVQISAIGYT